MATGADIRNDLVCRICLNVLNDPRVLTCGHTFCFECIRRDYQRLQLTLGICPLCKESYNVPQRDIRKLRKNFSVNDVLDSLRSAGHRCAICQGGDGTFICLKCKLNMCRHCSRRNMINCRHELLPIEDLNSRPLLRDVIQRSRSKQTCPSHPDQEVNLFCQTCKLVMCYFCRLRDHPHHDTQELREAVANLRAKNIPGLLENKTRAFDQTIESLRRELSFASVTYWRGGIEEEMASYRYLRENCSELYIDMNELFHYGSDKTIMELFREREEAINDILTIPTHNFVWRCTICTIYTVYSVFVHITNNNHQNALGGLAAG
ncbi:E3 ubiquitin-protein ligase TRIM56-like [Pecten maximus]|uniref:E3 ubiquitin-protein ligase TRIM56-like n=1 Tax=Pecten maximus TaxID=6579 RepID=UPI00145908C3|nr:E3 ubiquitin-protein ligase TRIM56-like [Pecten maximus]